MAMGHLSVAIGRAVGRTLPTMSQPNSRPILQGVPHPELTSREFDTGESAMAGARRPNRFSDLFAAPFTSSAHRTRGPTPG
jgi:hypothetical protein